MPQNSISWVASFLSPVPSTIRTITKCVRRRKKCACRTYSKWARWNWVGRVPAPPTVFSGVPAVWRGRCYADSLSTLEGTGERGGSEGYSPQWATTRALRSIQAPFYFAWERQKQAGYFGLCTTRPRFTLRWCQAPMYRPFISIWTYQR